MLVGKYRGNPAHPDRKTAIMPRRGKATAAATAADELYVAGFHRPTKDEILRACGEFPWTTDTNRVKHREKLLLGSGGGGKTSISSLNHLDTLKYYQQTNNQTFWSNLPAPVDETSWLAQVNEQGQTFDEYVHFITLRSGKFKPNSNPDNPHIYILPISEEEGRWPETGPALDGILEYVSAFFCRDVIKLDYVYLKPNPGQNSRKPVIWRTSTHECEITGRLSKSSSRFQTHVDGLLTEIAAVRDDGCYNGQAISNAFAVVGITSSDLYSGESDLFIAGMAAGGSKVAVLSLARYHPHLKMCPFHWDDYSYLSNPSTYSYYEDEKRRRKIGSTTPPSFDSLSTKSQSEYIRRAGKLIVHEICHVYGIDHCIFYDCLMNGTGHLVEDFSAPSHLCPVCLRKLQFRLGFDVEERYEGLQRVFDKWNLRAESKWIEDRLKVIRSTDSSEAPAVEESKVGTSHAANADASTQRKRRKVARTEEVVDLTSDVEENCSS